MKKSKGKSIPRKDEDYTDFIMKVINSIIEVVQSN